MSENSTSASLYEALDPKQGAILGIIASPGVIANLLTIIVTLKLLRHQKMTPNVFVFALACMDFGGIVIICAPTFLCYIFKHWVGGDHMCKFQGFMTLFFSLGSGFLATCMSVDRYVAVRWPLYHRQYITVQVVQKIVLGLVLLSVTVSILPVVGFGAFVMNLTGTYCTLDWFAKATEDVAFSCIFASLGFLLILTVLFCNINVVFKLYRRRDKIRSMVNESGKKEERKNTSLDRQFAKMMIVISAIFLLCWTPFMVRIICNISGVWKSWSADLQSSRLLLLNLVLDPFTYVLTRKHYRRALWTMCCGWRKKKTSALKGNSSLTSSSRNLRTTKSSDVSLDVLKYTNQGREESVDSIETIDKCSD